MKLIIQKQYLILVEISENIFRVFLVIVNFVFDINCKTLAFMFDRVEDFYNFIKKAKKEGVDYFCKVINYFKALFGFNIFKIKILNITVSVFYNCLYKIDYLNKRFLKYSNLLAPPLL